jgi:hypothetical protein
MPRVGQRLDERRLAQTVDSSLSALEAPARNLTAVSDELCPARDLRIFLRKATSAIL